MRSLAYKREYQRNWRAANPHYTRNWNRLHRNVRIKDTDLPNQVGGKIKTNEKYSKYYVHFKKGHCNKCTILLTSSYAEGHNGKTCGQCLHRLSTVVKK